MDIKIFTPKGLTFGVNYYSRFNFYSSPPDEPLTGSETTFILSPPEASELPPEPLVPLVPLELPELPEPLVPVLEDEPDEELSELSSSSSSEEELLLDDDELLLPELLLLLDFLEVLELFGPPTFF